MHRHPVLRVLLVLYMLLPALVQAAPASYTLVHVDGLLASRLDRGSGAIVGQVLVDGKHVAAILFPTPQVIGTLPDGFSSDAFGSAADVVVGSSGTGPFSTETHAFRWTLAGGIQDLGTTDSPALLSVAYATNGPVTVGAGDRADGVAIVPLLWRDPTQPPTVLATLGGTGGAALAVSQAGLVVGYARTTAGALHAVLWDQAGAAVDLHPVPGDRSLASDITDASPALITGDVSTPQGTRGFRLPVGGTALLLAPLPGDDFSVAVTSNDAGDTVGHSSKVSPPGAPPSAQVVKAVLWDTSGTPIELLTRVTNGTGWTLEQALGIGNSGVIVGVGTFNGLRDQIWLLSPVAASPAPQAPPKEREKEKEKEPRRRGK